MNEKSKGKVRKLHLMENIQRKWEPISVKIFVTMFLLKDPELYKSKSKTSFWKGLLTEVMLQSMEDQVNQTKVVGVYKSYEMEQTTYFINNCTL